MEELNGQVLPPPAAETQGQVEVPPAGVIPEGAVVQPPAASPAPQEGQTQGQVDVNVQEALRIANQRQAEIYRLREEVKNLRQVQQPRGITTNPYDPQTQPNEWWQWRDQQLARAVAQETTQGIVGTLMQTAQRQAEMQWQNQHPGIDINQAKLFAQERWGVQSFTPQILDDAVALMGMSQRLAQTEQQTAQRAITQFRQPQNTAQPIRGTAGAGQVPVQLSFEKLLPMYVSDPGVADKWDPRLREAFFTELELRSSTS